MFEHMHLFLTCEHASCRIPQVFQRLGIPKKIRLSHRGWDPGASQMARKLQRESRAPLLSGSVSRLIVDLNRLPESTSLFSRYWKNADEHFRLKTRRTFYEPWLRQAESGLCNLQKHGLPVLHLSVHSFTPVLKGKRRKMDIGLLYDPSRPGEKAFCQAWKQAFHRRRPELKVFCNQPYRGWVEGHVTQLRRKYRASEYLGIELEINQKYPLGDAAAWNKLQGLIMATLKDLKTFRPGRALRHRPHESARPASA